MRVEETNFAGISQSEAPIKDERAVSRAVIEVGVREPGSGSETHSEILRKLRWSSQESSTSRNLTTLLDRIREMGIEDPDTYLSLRDAAQKSGVAERTLRRYIADGQLETEKVKGPRGWEHRVYVPALFSVLQEKAGAFERARSNPLEEMGRELAGLCRTIVEQQTLAERRTNRLLDEIRNQSRVIDELRSEQRDARAQMHSLQDQMIKALMPPPKPSLLDRLFPKKSE